jgi:hypothetical protein
LKQEKFKTNAEKEEIIKDDSQDQCSDDVGSTNNAIAAVNTNNPLDIAADVYEAEYNMSEKSSDSEVLEDDEKIDALSSFDQKNPDLVMDSGPIIEHVVDVHKNLNQQISLR